MCAHIIPFLLSVFFLGGECKNQLIRKEDKIFLPVTQEVNRIISKIFFK